MDSRGNIRPIRDGEEDEALRRGLIPIPEEDLERVRAMSKADRKGWYKAALTKHPLAPIPGESEADRNARRNARKRARRAR